MLGNIHIQSQLRISKILLFISLFTSIIISTSICRTALSIIAPYVVMINLQSVSIFTMVAEEVVAEKDNCSTTGRNLSHQFTFGDGFRYENPVCWYENFFSIMLHMATCLCVRVHYTHTHSHTQKKKEK